MDSMRRFIANFQKHGKISLSSGKKVKVLTNIVNIKKPEGNLFKDAIQKQNASTIQDATENSEKVDASSPETNTTDAKNYATVDTESNCSNINTSECLAEFNEILQEINTEYNTESVTLDEIDDVLNEMTEGNEETFFNIPRLDLHDLGENFGFFENDAEPTDSLRNSDENIEQIDIDDFIGSDNFDEELEAFDAEKLLENHIIEKTKNTKDFRKKNVESSDIISISSENSQVNETNVKLIDDTEVLEPVNIQLEGNNERNTPNELRNVLELPFQDETLEDFNIDSTQNNLNKETKKTTFEEDKLNFNPKNVNKQESKSQEVPFAYDFNRNQDKKQDESKINIDPKNTINMIDDNENVNMNNFQDIISMNDSDETESVNDKNEKQENTKPKEIDSDDCGYLSSDFEFITEDEAKLDGLIVNFNPKVTKKFNKLKKVKTIEISVDRYSNFYSSESSPESIQDDPNIMNNTFDLQSSPPIDPHKSDFAQNFTRDFDVQENLTGLRSFRRNKDTHPISNCQNSQDFVTNYGSECKDLFTSQQNCTGPINKIDCPGETNIGDNQSCDFGEYPQDLNDLGNNPGPSNISQRLSDLGNRPSPNILQANCPKENGPETSNEDIQKWRAFQKRSRNQFFLDQSYREHHSVPSNEDYLQMFNPNYLPLSNQSMRLENKSTLSYSTMLIEYDGVGFDMQMMRGNIESEDEEVKQEAAACARRILQMYPRENRKRQRSRRF